VEEIPLFFLCLKKKKGQNLENNFPKKSTFLHFIDYFSRSTIKVAQ